MVKQFVIRNGVTLNFTAFSIEKKKNLNFYGTIKSSSKSALLNSSFKCTLSL